MRSKLRVVGTVLSAICAVHCLLMPVLCIFISVAGHDLLHHTGWEVGILGTALLISAVNIFFHYREHRKILPAVLWALSLAIIVPTILAHWHTGIAVGGILLAVAQIIDGRLHHQIAHTPALG